jgi:magnesium transporter
MPAHLIDPVDGGATVADRGAVERLLGAGEVFWLDLFLPEPSELDLLREPFGFHPLAIEDSERFGQRPKLDDYDDVAMLVLYGANEDEDGLVEVHCFYSDRFLVTVRRDDCPALANVHRRFTVGGDAPFAGVDHPIGLLYRIADALVDGFFPRLDALAVAIEELEDRIVAHPSDDQLQALLALKRSLVLARRVIVPQRDLFARLAGGVVRLPGLDRAASRYFRDIYDHLIRVNEMIDAYRDLLTGATEVYLSSVSNRLGAVTKQLAVIATIFLPLTFVTGFFGQNFPWMVEHIGGPWWFLILGVGLQLLTLALLVVWFRRQGWWFGAERETVRRRAPSRRGAGAPSG